MNTKQMVGAVVSTVLKVAVAIVVIMYVYKGALFAYEYGYRIFTEPAMTSKEQGWDVTVEITMGKGASDIGKILENKGLIRDANLFYIQAILSEYKDAFYPGIYTLNTSMTAKEMMEVMSTKPVEETVE